MKFRSRVAAFAAAAGLAAGLVVVGGGGTAHAADTVLIDCANVAGTASIKPALTNVAVPNAAIAIKGPLVGGADPFKPVADTENCTGVLATPGDGGTPDDVGNLVKVSGKLVGSSTCNLIADPPITDPLVPVAGAITFTFTTLLPTGKPAAASTFVRLGGGTDPLKPDELVFKNGIVTKGVGVGGNVYGGFIFAPYDSKTKGDFDNDSSTKDTTLPNQSFLNSSGVIVAGAGSSTIGLNCIAGAGGPGATGLTTAFFSTDGTGLLGGVESSSMGISLPPAD